VYNAAVFQLRKRVAASSWWGGNFSYTYSRLNDNQFGQSNYYSASPGVLNNYEVIPGSPYYDPDAEYGRSLLDSPHKIVLSPIIQLPWGEGRAFLNHGGLLDYLVGGWTISAVVTLQSGFPIGVRQNPDNIFGNISLGGTQRPNVVPGVDPVVPGDITDRLRANPKDNLFLNPAAFSLAPAFTYGNAPRILDGVRGPGRNGLDMSFSKDFRTGGSTRATLRLEMINVTNTPWFVGFTTSQSQFGSASFGQVTSQANYSRLTQISFRFQF
jgi:hypothetical protein